MKLIYSLLASALVLSACGSSDEPMTSPQLDTSATDSAPEASTPQNDGGYSTSIIMTDPDGINQITWEDLMPEGEEVLLAQMYEDYYAELQQNMMAQQQRLQDAGKDGNGEPIDIAALIAEGSANDTMDQVGTFNVVEDLDGLQIRLPGYVVPLDFNADNEYQEFLLVPYFGACLHTPPPPPNQIVYVKSDPAAKVESIYEPVWVEGTMKTGRFDTETANSAYELTLSKIEIYEY